MNLHLAQIPWQPFALLGGFAAAVIVITIVASNAEKKRRAGLSELWRELGLTASEDGQGVRTSLHVAMAPLDKLVSRLSQTVWVAEGDVDGVGVTLLEHQYTTGSGKSKQTHQHAVVSMAVPAAWPKLDVYAEHLFHKIGDLFGAKDIQLDDAAFNAKYRVKSDSEDFAVLFLSPEAQREMMGWERGTTLTVKDGRMLVYRPKHLSADGWKGLLAAAIALRKAVPAELEAWEG